MEHGIEALEHGIKALEHVIKALEHVIKALEHVIEALEHIIKALEHIIKALEHVIEALERIIEALERIIEIFWCLFQANKNCSRMMYEKVSAKHEDGDYKGLFVGQIILTACAISYFVPISVCFKCLYKR